MPQEVTLRQYRLRTIMALIAIIAVSLWCGMLIERARRPAQGNTLWKKVTVTRPVNGTLKTYTVARFVKTSGNPVAVTRPGGKGKPDPPEPK
jgi:hypothetical protein